ncbi:isoleucine-tRNA ligase [Orbilia oligospora]|nr:isoleucine-tRNA ligase [Orbilia oligospora]KAF3276028.1 isoleucine-tRNA ligase [Orbilia oligospora]
MMRSLFQITKHGKRSIMTSATMNSRVNLKDTLKLPTTTFPIRSSLTPASAKELLEKCTDDLYKWQWENLPSDKTFVFHDGPPFANGALHTGHAMNKILKDIIVRYNIKLGKRVSYIPGWDCHGLPIELKALQNIRGTTENVSVMSPAEAIEKNKDLHATEIRGLARKLAAETVEAQKAGFRSWGVIGDWENAYRTMDLEYEVRQLRVFKEMTKKGLIYRHFKPVYWSPSSRTALAEAELEYNEAHNSKAATVKFPLANLGSYLSSLPNVDKTISAAIWTTTPWSIPGNLAILINPDLKYVVVNSSKYGQLLAGEERVEHLQKLMDEDLEVIVKDIPGKALLDVTYNHPLFPSTASPHPVLAADYVTSDTGTGLVHCAPGHGMEDYLTCQKHNIQPFSPIDDSGNYTSDALPTHDLTGLPVLSVGQDKILSLLSDHNVLLGCQPKFLHKYPYDWRTKLPIIQRATPQWFAGVEMIKESATSEIEKIQFVPEAGQHRLHAYVSGRDEWCISRQRTWGVPIPALYEVESGDALLTEESVEHIISVIEKKGTDAWWSDPDSEEWVAPQYRDKKYKRGTETMDVWFDSGTSWTLIREKLGEREGRALVDIYLEGSDQHRGWFQSSLLTCVASTGKAPYEKVVTHGFVLDEKGKKMSKSLGNIISPQEIIDGSYWQRAGQMAKVAQKPEKAKKQKAEKKPKAVAESSQAAKKEQSPDIDTLRLWVAMTDFTADGTIGEKVLRFAQEALRKYRMTGRFLLGNLGDWDGKEVPYNELLKIDQYALYRLAELNQSSKAEYDTFAFSKIFHSTNVFNKVFLSAFYLNILKDRLYVDDGISRASAQTTLFYILKHYLNILSPIVPLLTEEIWSHSTLAITQNMDQPVKSQWVEPPAEWSSEAAKELGRKFQSFDSCVEAVNFVVEDARNAKSLRANLEADIILVVPEGGEAQKFLKEIESELTATLLCSKVHVSTSQPSNLDEGAWSYSKPFTLLQEEGTVIAVPAKGQKCPRCWMYTSRSEVEACDRCAGVVERLGSCTATA